MTSSPSSMANKSVVITGIYFLLLFAVGGV